MLSLALIRTPMKAKKPWLNKDAKGNLMNRNNQSFAPHKHYSYKGNKLCKIIIINPYMTDNVDDVTCTHCKRLIRKETIA